MKECKDKLVEIGQEEGKGTKYHNCHNCVYFERSSQTCYNSLSENFEKKIDFTDQFAENLHEVSRMLDFLINEGYVKANKEFKVEA